MMIPDCHKRLESALADLKSTLVILLTLSPISITAYYYYKSYVF